MSIFWKKIYNKFLVWVFFGTMVSIQIKMWACFGIIWSFKWEHFWQIMLIQIQMWAYSGKIWYPNMIIFWQKVHSNSNVSIIWQSITNPNVSLFWQNMIYKCEQFLAKRRFQSQCEHYLAKSKKEHFLANLIGSMNFLTFCQNILLRPKLDFWLKCDFVPLRVSQQRKEAGKNADFAIGGYSNNYSKKHREFRWSQRFFPLSIKYDFLEFLGCLFPPSAPLAKKIPNF